MLYKLGVFHLFLNSLVLVLEETKSPGVSHGSRVIYFLFCLFDLQGNTDSKTSLYKVVKA